MRSSLALLLLLPSLAFGADGSGDGDSTSIQTWHDLPGTVDGDTYTMNPGTFGWGPDQLLIIKGVHIQGSGQGVTFIEDDVTNEGNDASMMARVPTGEVIRFSDFTLRNGLRPTTGGSSVAKPDAVLSFTGGWSPVNITNRWTDEARFVVERVTVENRLGGNFVASRGAWGLISHCTIGDGATTMDDILFGYQEHGAVPPVGGDRGDGVYYNAGDNLNTDAYISNNDCFIVMENCTVLNNSNNNDALCDGWMGVRFLIRHNTISGFTCVVHGAETGASRGGAAMVIHDNDFTYGDSSIIARYRSGTGLVYDNTLTGDYIGYPIALSPYRWHEIDLGNWSTCDGTSQWDLNDTTDGAGTPGGAGDGVFDSGTSDGTDDNELTDSSKSWTTNQWVGYHARYPTYTQNAAPILSNTPTTLTLQTGRAGVQQVPIGTAYEIRRVLRVLDQPGVFGSDIVNSDSVTVRETGPPDGQQDQYVEPLYSWNNEINDSVNVSDGTMGLFGAGNYPTVIEDTHYYDSSSKTDAETDGLVYTEYTFPHPLATGATMEGAATGTLSTTVLSVGTLTIGQ